MPPQVAQQLLSAGHLGIDRIGRVAKISSCNKCGMRIWRGLIREYLPCHAFPVPLNAIGEAMFLLAGGSTFRLFNGGNSYSLDFRWSWHINGGTAGDPANRYDVLAGHVHHWALPAAWGAASVLPIADPHSHVPSHPPF